MDFTDFSAGPNDNDRRLDRILRNFLPDLPLSEIYGLIRKGLIKVNHKKAKQNDRVSEGDVISIASFLLGGKNAEQPEKSVNGPDIEKLIVFRNEHILLLNKPYDIKVHGDKDSLDEYVKIYYRKHTRDNSLSFNPGPLHRLDRKTTGLLAFSFSLEGARWFSENIQTHTIKKIYRGIVQGNLREQEFWEDFISKNEGDADFHTVKVSETDGKRAKTTVTPLKHGNHNGKDITECAFLIETGRTHQIRSQCQAHGYPLIGDTAYGGIKLSGSKRDFFLHAEKLVFPKDNPLGLPEVIECPPDNIFLFV